MNGRLIVCETCLTRDGKFGLLKPGQECPYCGDICPEHATLSNREIHECLKTREQ